MKKIVLFLGITLAFSTSAMAVDIAISTKAGWWGQAAADQEMQDIVNNVKGASVELFPVTALDALASWVIAHTGDGVPDLLILCGNFPETIYRSGNAQPNGSLAELFLDDGNTIINTGDYIFYVGTTANNDAGGLQNMMDVPAAAMWGDDSLATIFTPTADGRLYTPSLPAAPCNRPWFPAQFVGTDWHVELVLAQNSDGSQVMPGILRNSVTGGRVGAFFQVADQFTDIRGEVISEWINNWYLKIAASPTGSSNPSPADEATDVPFDVVASWKPRALAVAHDVYFGVSFADVIDASRADPKGVLVSEGQTAIEFKPADLQFGQTYFWRVDEVNGAPDNTIFKGEIWSFTVEPLSYPVTPIAATASSFQQSYVPQNTINGSGLNAADEHSLLLADMWMSGPAGPHWIQYEFDKTYTLDKMWVWNANQIVEAFVGFGAKDVTVEYSVDGATWTTLEGVPEFAQGTGAATYTANTVVNFGSVTARFVKLTINSNWGGVAPQTSLSEVRFFYVPVQAFRPQPAVGATDVSVATDLSWRPGRKATSHKIAIGTDSAAVAAGAGAQTVTEHRYTPDNLALDTQYFWKVDEIGDGSEYPGNVWHFTTEAYVVVDDFESYGDNVDAQNTIWHTWIDGLPDQASGSQVGYDQAPFAERTIVRGGSQAVPLRYDNSKFAFSEATRTFDSAQNWTAHGIKSVSLWFRGATGNTGTLYLKLNNTKVAYDGPATDIGIAGWHKWNIVLAGTSANLSKVTSLTIGGQGGGSGTGYIDDIRLSSTVSVPPTSNIGIAISAQANWWSQTAANREMEEIVDSAQAPVVVFNATDKDGLAEWLSAHTSNGVPNLLILCGQLPDTIYAPGNTQADDSIVEKFLDAGNTVVNTGDWIFYVVNNAGTNGAAGLQTIMDIPGVTVAGGDNTAVAVTAQGQEFTPSLQAFATDRPFHLDTLAGDWSVELVLAQNADGTLADPVVVRNSVTGGRIGVFYQAANEDNLPRGEVISEWINNWYLDAAGGN